MTNKGHMLLTSAWFPSKNNTNGVFVKEQAEALCRSGYRVTALIVTYSLFGRWLRSFMSNDGVEYDKSELLTIVRKHVVFPAPARWYKQPELAVKQYIVNKVYRSLKCQFGVTPPTLIHHHCLSDNSFLAEGLARLYSVPYIFTEYSNYYSYSELDKFSWLETFEEHRAFVQNAAARISATEIRAKAYEDIFGAPFLTIPNLVVDLFAAPLPKREADLPFTFICVAILDPRKRQDILLKAFARGFKSQNARLLIVGNGVSEGTYKALAVELGIQDQVFFMGKQEREQVRSLFDESHVAVLCSDQETFGIALGEAMFRGLPVISTRSGGPEEVVTPETGVLVPKGDAIALSAKMKEVFDNYDRYSAQDIRASAIMRYSEAAIVPKLTRVYEDVTQAVSNNRMSNCPVTLLRRQ